MAKILDVSACSATNIFYSKSGTFQFLEDAHKETAADILRGQIGESYNQYKGYALYGCNFTTIPFSHFVEGAIFFNGEVFHAPSGAPVTPGVGEVVVVNIDTTQYTTFADPTDFTDGIPRNVHNIRQAVYASGVSGTGTICDYADLVFVSSSYKTNITMLGTWSSTGTSYYLPSYKKINDNQVALAGYVSNASGYSGVTSVLQLPFTLTKEIAMVWFIDDATTITPIRMLITTGGLMQIDGTVATTALLALDGITFRIL